MLLLHVCWSPCCHGNLTKFLTVKGKKKNLSAILKSWKSCMFIFVFDLHLRQPSQQQAQHTPTPTKLRLINHCLGTNRRLTHQAGRYSRYVRFKAPFLGASHGGNGHSTRAKKKKKVLDFQFSQIFLCSSVVRLDTDTSVKYSLPGSATVVSYVGVFCRV